MKKPLERLNLKEMPNILAIRITVKKDKFQIKKPQVFKIPSENIYLIYGIIEMANSNILKVDRDEFTSALHEGDSSPQITIGTGKPNDSSEEDENKNNDFTTDQLDMDTDMNTDMNTDVSADLGFSHNDLEIVMGQTEATKEQAINALKDANGDLIQAIMSLTS